MEFLKKAYHGVKDTVLANNVTKFLFGLTLVLAIVGYLTTIFPSLQPTY